MPLDFGVIRDDTSIMAGSKTSPVQAATLDSSIKELERRIQEIECEQMIQSMQKKRCMKPEDEKKPEFTLSALQGISISTLCQMKTLLLVSVLLRSLAMK